ncbi:MAG: Rid family detoxifying hydrolase [Calditrichaeota bacterium]|nr:Rid family detoxifying hydrolase [Calditrichota bacterium]
MVYRTLNLLLCLLTLIACDRFRHRHDSKREVITTDLAPKGIGPYSQAIKSGNEIYVAGQIGLTAAGQMVDGGIQAETKQAMENIKAILAAANYTMNDIVQCQVYLSDIANYKAMNEIYLSYFTVSPPARAVVAVSKIPLNAQVEIMVVAKK